MVVFGKKWLRSGKNGYIRTKVVEFGKSGCIQAKVVVCFWAKVVVLGQKLFYSDRVVVSGQK